MLLIRNNCIVIDLRRDNPNENDTAVLDIYIRESNVMNVFIGKSLSGPFTFVPKIERTPSLTDPVGTNARNPQQHNVRTLLY